MRACATLAVLLGCSLGASQQDEFQIYAVKFHAAARRYTQVIPTLGQDPISRTRIAKIQIHFGEVRSKKVAAHCITIGENGYEIIVDEPHWNSYGPFRRELVIFHELGHCVLNQIQHRPNSIMHYDILSEDDYLLHREQYLQELFNYQ